MSMIWVTDVTTEKKVAVNTRYITAVFEPPAGSPEKAVAIIGLVNGVIATSETVDAIVEMIGETVEQIGGDS